MAGEKKRSCCGKGIEPGTGKRFGRKHGTVRYFDSSKCYRNMIQLKRVARTTRWTAKAHDEKDSRLKNAAAKAAADKKE